MLLSAIRLGRFRFGAAGKATALLSFALMANLMPLATFAAMMPAIDRSWGLNASEAGWIGGIYFAGYAVSVPMLAGATDRLDARWIFVGSSSAERSLQSCLCLGRRLLDRALATFSKRSRPCRRANARIE